MSQEQIISDEEYDLSYWERLKADEQQEQEEINSREADMEKAEQEAKLEAEGNYLKELEEDE